MFHTGTINAIEKRQSDKIFNVIFNKKSLIFMMDVCMFTPS